MYRNIETNIDEFINFFNDGLETFFLKEKEKRILAKLVFALREYKDMIYSEKVLKFVHSNTKYKAVVIAGGLFGNVSQKIMTNTYEIIDEAVPIFACHINNIIELVNDWISETGKYFIINPKLLEFHS